jgi:hypothetical protein
MSQTYENHAEFNLTYIVLLLFRRMVRHSVPETYENDTEFDLAYIVLFLFPGWCHTPCPILMSYENNTKFNLTYIVLLLFPRILC